MFIPVANRKNTQLSFVKLNVFEEFYNKSALPGAGIYSLLPQIQRNVLEKITVMFYDL